MDWSKGLSARYRAFIVDPVTWRDKEEIYITGGSISKSEDNLRESASISVSEYDYQKETWIRVYLDARQSGESYYGALFTGLASSPSKEMEGTFETNSLQCYSVLKPINDILLSKGWYVSYGTDTAAVLRSLLNVIKGTPLIIDGVPPNMAQTIIAENGETNLSMADKIISSIGWRMYILGDGTIVVTELSSSPSAYFDSISVDSLESRIRIDNNWFDCPNVFRAVDGNFSAVYKDEDPNSPLSIPNRGREIWMEESGCATYYGESLAQYAERRLQEEQQIYTSISYTRRFDPNVNVSDIVAINYPANGVSGLFYVASQSIDIGYGAPVSEVGYKI